MERHLVAGLEAEHPHAEVSMKWNHGCDESFGVNGVHLAELNGRLLPLIMTGCDAGDALREFAGELSNDALELLEVPS